MLIKKIKKESKAFLMLEVKILEKEDLQKNKSKCLSHEADNKTVQNIKGETLSPLTKHSVNYMYLNSFEKYRDLMHQLL